MSIFMRQSRQFICHRASQKGGGGGEQLRECPLLRGKVGVTLKVSFENVHFYAVKLR